MITVTAFSRLPYEKRINPVTKEEYVVRLEVKPIHEDLDVVLDTIREERLKGVIEQMRFFYDADHKKYDELKHDLPVCIFTGIFNDFNNAAFVSPSDRLIVDFDKIPIIRIAEVRSMIENDPYTHFCFMSPSGRGFKVGVKVKDNINNEIHNAYLDALKVYYNSPYWDDNCKGISRACFFSSDKNLYLNPDSKVWTIRKLQPNPFTPTISIPASPVLIPGSETGKIIRYLEGGWTKFPMLPGNRHDSTFKRAREMAEWGISEEVTQDYLSQYIAPDFPKNELQKQINNAYQWVRKRGNIGLKYREL